MLLLVSSAQKDFKPGFIITLDRDTILGEIDYRGDLVLRKLCRFRSLESEKSMDYYPDDIIGFRFKNDKFFVDKKLENGNSYFLECLIQGRLNVFYYRDEEGDHYLIEKKDLPLKELPPERTISKILDGGSIVNYKTKDHLILLNLYTSDAAGFQSNIENLRNLDHYDLIRLVKQYNRQFVDDFTIIYAKELPIISGSAEIVCGLYFGEGLDFPYYGMNLYLWAPRTSEKLYLKTGLVYSRIHYVENYNLIRFPIHLMYQFSRERLRPNIFIGTTNLFLKSEYESQFNWLISIGGGLNYLISKKLSVTLHYTADFSSISNALIDNGSFSLVANTVNMGIRIGK